ncbi:MAG: YlxR family protein [Clostridia bacterium]|jgi:predicted RNA-binding protein YlxR (DUF448 family)|nr:YlxR family protein [Clostridia bacterium]MDH7572381.1 YlxR family protein [Clostridia bacterium]
MVKPKRIPERMCVGCRAKRPKKELVRVVRTPEGQILVDATGKQAGRGAYICPEEACLNRAVKSKALERALGVPVQTEILVDLAVQIRRRKEEQLHGGD